jgi:RNA polymerase sigma factor (sigma-70 family)
VDPWLEELRAGRAEAAWALFIDRYRRLIFSAIRHYAKDADDVMDVFAHVCASLRENDLARLRRYADAPASGARFSTWLVAVVRNLTVDWFRHRDGRPRRQAPADLNALEQRIYQAVFVEGHSHEECFQRLRLSETPAVSSHDFAEALRTTYRRLGRGAHGTDRMSGEVALAAASPEQVVLAEDAADRVAGFLDLIDSRDRLAIQLFVIDELPAAEVARIVGWPNAKMVYNRVARGLAGLRRQLGDAGLSRDDFRSE